MPRILRSPRSKSFRLENVSVPNADGARCGRRRNPERTQSEVRLGSRCEELDLSKPGPPCLTERTSTRCAATSLMGQRRHHLICDGRAMDEAFPGERPIFGVERGTDWRPF